MIIEPLLKNSYIILMTFLIAHEGKEMHPDGFHFVLTSRVGTSSIQNSSVEEDASLPFVFHLHAEPGLIHVYLDPSA